MNRKSGRHPDDSEGEHLELGPPFGDRYWSTPGSIIERSKSGSPRWKGRKHFRKKSDPKEASGIELMAFFFAVALLIIGVGLVINAVIS